MIPSTRRPRRVRAWSSLLVPLLVLAPALASASIGVGPKTRVRGFGLPDGHGVGAESFASRTSRQAYEVWYGGHASGSLVAPSSAGELVPRARPPLAQPGEDLFVGTYNQSRRANLKSGLSETHTPHHAVQDAVSTTTHGRGATISLRKDLHELTATMRSRRNLGSLREHLAADIRELRRILSDAGMTQP